VKLVGSLLSTRCKAYELIFDQLVRNVGSEGPGGGGASAAPILIFNSNTNTVEASPVTNNINTAAASSKAKAKIQGLGVATIAAAALGTALLARVILSGGGGGDGGCRSCSSSPPSSPRPARLPRGKNGREKALVSVMSECEDEAALASLLKKVGRLACNSQHALLLVLQNRRMGGCVMVDRRCRRGW
jgi:hypothetical protein